MPSTWRFLAAWFCMQAAGAGSFRLRADALTGSAARRSAAEPADDEEKVVADIKQGLALEKSLGCDALGQVLRQTIEGGVTELSSMCTDSATAEVMESCSFRENSHETLAALALVVAGVAEILDSKHCLGPAFTEGATQALLAELMQFLQPVIHSGSEEEQQVMSQTYGNLVLWQHSLQGFADSLLDRDLLLPTDIEDYCPTGCKRCRRSSRTKDQRRFEFTCYLGSGAEAPSTVNGAGSLTCTAPKKRMLKFWEFKSTCTVKDWVALAFQKVRVAALVKCSQLVLLPLYLGRMPTPEEHKACVQLEQKMVLPAEEVANYLALQNATRYAKKDAAADPGPRGALLLYIGLGEAAGLAALRLASKGNSLENSAAEGRAQPADLLAIFAQQFPTEGGSELFYDDSGLVTSDLLSVEACTPPRSTVQKAWGIGRGMLTAAATLFGLSASFSTYAAIGFFAWLLMLFVNFNWKTKLAQLAKIPLAAATFALVTGVATGSVVYMILGGRFGGCEASVLMQHGTAICATRNYFGREKSYLCPDGTTEFSVVCDKDYKGHLTVGGNSSCPGTGSSSIQG